MNNLVLQKLIHSYQLIKPMEIDFDQMNRKQLGVSEYFDLKEENKITSAFDKKWKEQFHIVRHINDGTRKNPNGAHWFRNDIPLDDGGVKERISICPKLLHNITKKYSQAVTQSGKFYINETANNCVTEEETKSLLEEIKFFAPYPSTFLQMENEHTVANILVTDEFEGKGILRKENSEGEFYDEEKETLYMTMNLWHKKSNMMIIDFNIYEIAFADGKYGFKVINSKFSDMTDIEKNEEDDYVNESLKDWVFTIVDSYFKFMVYLQFPQICDVKSVKGRNSESWFDIPTKFTTNNLRQKPKFEHKELVINMFGDSSTQKSGDLQGVRAGGTALHSVRKHLRRLPNGKFTWVKAHFRGTKQAGIITKDYRVEE